jgi:putative flippase GtrA
MTAEPMQGSASLLRRPGIQQFLKFCVVGASSTAISAVTYALLVYRSHVNPQLAALAGFLLAVTNGFIWNNRWTFRNTSTEDPRVRYVKFVLVNAVGLVLNQAILYAVLRLLGGESTPAHQSFAPMIAFAVATGIVMFWNFLANKYWTFKSEAPGA